MPSELEGRLERALGEASPGPDPSVSDRALRAAVDALPSPRDVRRGRRRRIGLLLAACTAAFVSGGVTLAATGAHLPVVNPEPARTHEPLAPATRPDTSLLPADARIWATGGGHATLISSGRPARRVGGRVLTAFAASPGSLYLVEGHGARLRAIETRTGRVAWRRHDLGGRTVAAVWSPFPIRIAYLLRTATGFTVGDLWGTGTHPFTVDTHAAPVTPAWRWDSKALAYVTASGTVVVHDVIGGVNRPLEGACGIRRPTAVAFAPVGAMLAVADRAGRVALVDPSGTRGPRCLAGAPGRPHLAWLGRTSILVAARSSLTRYDLSGAEAAARTVSTGRPVESIAAAPDGRRIVLALRTGASTAVVATTPPAVHAPSATLAGGLTLVHLPGPVQVQWR